MVAACQCMRRLGLQSATLRNAICDPCTRAAWCDPPGQPESDVRERIGHGVGTGLTGRRLGGDSMGIARLRVMGPDSFDIYLKNKPRWSC
eukprot:3640694-Rhodomonas_salina.1